MDGLRAVGREKRGGIPRPAFRGIASDREFALAECAHKHPHSLTSTPPEEHQTNSGTSGPGQNSNNSLYGNLTCDSGHETCKSGISDSGTSLKITPFLLNLWVRGDGFEPPFQG